VNYGTSTHLGPQQVLDLAARFFGPSGLGLRIAERGQDCIILASSQGSVSVRVQPLVGDTEVFLSTEGLDEQVRQFMVYAYEEAQDQAKSGG